MGHRGPRQGQGCRLIAPLATGENLVAVAGQGLPGHDDMIDPVDMVDVQRTEVHELGHCTSLSIISVMRPATHSTAVSIMIRPLCGVARRAAWA